MEGECGRESVFVSGEETGDEVTRGERRERKRKSENSRGSER